jgi:uncharacterized coiled-coil protein SlyX
MSYDQDLREYILELETELTQANAKIVDLTTHLAETHRKIALLEEQARHYYL